MVFDLLFTTHVKFTFVGWFIRNYHVFSYESRLGSHRRDIVGHRNCKNDGMTMLKMFWASFLADFLTESRFVECCAALSAPVRLGENEWDLKGGLKVLGESIIPGMTVISIRNNDNRFGRVLKVIRRGNSVLLELERLDAAVIGNDIMTQCRIMPGENFTISLGPIFAMETWPMTHCHQG